MARHVQSQRGYKFRDKWRRVDPFAWCTHILTICWGQRKKRQIPYHTFNTTYATFSSLHSVSGSFTFFSSNHYLFVVCFCIIVGKNPSSIVAELLEG